MQKLWMLTPIHVATQEREKSRDVYRRLDAISIYTHDIKYIRLFFISQNEAIGLAEGHWLRDTTALISN
jgi:hypothetical protein